MFQTDESAYIYLADDMIMKYHRYVTQLGLASTSANKLKLFSCHSLRVKEAVLLHETGKDTLYIKLRLRWLCNCFQVYLRNTKRVCEQHNAALEYVNTVILKALVLSEINIPESAVHDDDVTDTKLYTLCLYLLFSQEVALCSL